VTTGFFVAVLPQIDVQWASSDLSLFTPASAPVLPAASISKFEALTTSAATSTLQSGTQTSSPTSKASAGSNGLSTGAEAGIGVGIAIAVLLLISGIIYFVFRRRRRNKNAALQRAGSTEPYVDSKAELPHNAAAKRPQEVEAGGPLTAEAGPPPIPIASKPRFGGGIGRHELQGDFRGHEIGD
jgi:LPXTG-motif cell wall-anchored protein